MHRQARLGSDHEVAHAFVIVAGKPCLPMSSFPAGLLGELRSPLSLEGQGLRRVLKSLPIAVMSYSSQRALTGMARSFGPKGSVVAPV
jgi:hypothetical protein